MMIYFDHASTSLPKPKEVLDEMKFYLEHVGASPGRGSYKAQDASSEYMNNVRELLGHLYNVKKSSHVIFTYNATHSINIVVNGYLKENDHVLICSYSHNSTIRPLEQMRRKKNVQYDVFQVTQDGKASLEEIKKLVRPQTSLVVFTHASNVLGVRSEFEELIPYFNENKIAILLDVAQTSGYVNFDSEKLGIDFIAGSGHKTLLGPSGIGFLYIKNPEEVMPFLSGGSGGTSSASPTQPEIMPVKFEAGTLNYMGIAGLFGALKSSLSYSYEKLFQEGLDVTRYAWLQLSELPEIQLFGTNDFQKKIPVLSFSVEGLIPKTVEELLARDFQIATRAGLQCAPFCHRMIGTFPQGTLRVSFGHTNTTEEVDVFIKALKEILQKGRGKK